MNLDHNQLAHYQVLCAADTVIGYAGFWMMGMNATSAPLPPIPIGAARDWANFYC